MTSQALTVQQQPSQDAALLAVITKAAQDPSVDVSKMRELLDMKERIDAEHAKKQFIQSLHNFQAECPQITRSGGIIVNNVLRSRYSPYEDTMKIVRPYMQKWGFSESFDTQVNEAGQICAVTCTLSHVGGHSVQSTFPVTPDSSGSKNSIQAIGSALSYGKRYSLGAVLGLVFTNEDDDGKATAMLEESRAAVAIKTPNAPAKPVTSDRDTLIATIADMMEAAEMDDEALTVALNDAMAQKKKDWQDLASWTAADDKLLAHMATPEGFKKLAR